MPSPIIGNPFTDEAATQPSAAVHDPSPQPPSYSSEALPTNRPATQLPAQLPSPLRPKHKHVRRMSSALRPAPRPEVEDEQPLRGASEGSDEMQNAVLEELRHDRGTGEKRRKKKKRSHH